MRDERADWEDSVPGQIVQFAGVALVATMIIWWALQEKATMAHPWIAMLSLASGLVTATAWWFGLHAPEVRQKFYHEFRVWWHYEQFRNQVWWDCTKSNFRAWAKEQLGTIRR